MRVANFWSRLLGRKEGVTLTNDEYIRRLIAGLKSKTGQNVTISTALGVTTVLACMRVLAEGVAQVPLKLFKESEDGRQRRPAREHPLYHVLHRRPNPWQTSFEYRETLMFHAGLAGAHYSFINRVRGQIVELIPFEPHLVTPERDERTLDLRFKVRGKSGGEQIFPAESIWYVRGPSWDSWRGLKIVELAREAIGLSMAIEEQQGQFYANGAQTSGVLSIEGTLDEGQYKKLRKWLEEEHVGASNAARPMIVDRNAKWTQSAIGGADAQTIEQRNKQTEEICRAFRVMPIMVGYADKVATYASAEQMFLAHVVHTLSPWYERLEQSIDVNLLTDKDARDGIYAKFIVQGLLRGAMKDTADYLSRLVQSGIITRNEARAPLDYNALDGLDEPLTPTNMTAGSKPEPATET